MDISKRNTARRISVWVLIFALILMTLSASFALTAHAKNGVMGEIGDAAKEATSDVGDAVRDVVDEAADATDGVANDSDGMIGNEKDEAGSDTATDEGTSIGWIGLVIAIVIVIIAIVLIVILIPRKKKR
ncbi:MAG: hypothetical protein J6Q82_04200 [Clostridia bacterium]|nr:hypothetical protein [Clostridia bacterium]